MKSRLYRSTLVLMMLVMGWSLQGMEWGKHTTGKKKGNPNVVQEFINQQKKESELDATIRPLDSYFYKKISNPISYFGLNSTIKPTRDVYWLRVPEKTNDQTDWVVIQMKNMNKQKTEKYPTPAVRKVSESEYEPYNFDYISQYQDENGNFQPLPKGLYLWGKTSLFGELGGINIVHEADNGNFPVKISSRIGTRQHSTHYLFTKQDTVYKNKNVKNDKTGETFENYKNELTTSTIDPAMLLGTTPAPAGYLSPLIGLVRGGLNITKWTGKKLGTGLLWAGVIATSPAWLPYNYFTTKNYDFSLASCNVLYKKLGDRSGMDEDERRELLIKAFQPGTVTNGAFYGTDIICLQEWEKGNSRLEGAIIRAGNEADDAPKVYKLLEREIKTKINNKEIAHQLVVAFKADLFTANDVTPGDSKSDMLVEFTCIKEDKNKNKIFFVNNRYGNAGTYTQNKGQFIPNFITCGDFKINTYKEKYEVYGPPAGDVRPYSELAAKKEEGVEFKAIFDTNIWSDAAKIHGREMLPTAYERSRIVKGTTIENEIEKVTNKTINAGFAREDYIFFTKNDFKCTKYSWDPTNLRNLIKTEDYDKGILSRLGSWGWRNLISNRTEIWLRSTFLRQKDFSADKGAEYENYFSNHAVIKAWFKINESKKVEETKVEETTKN